MLIQSLALHVSFFLVLVGRPRDLQELSLYLVGALEVRGSLELQNGSLRILEEASMMTTLGSVLSSLLVLCASLGACRARRERSGT